MLGKMKNGFMIVIKKPAAVDWLKVPNSIIANAYGFYPRNVILEGEDLPKRICHIHDDPWIGVGATNIEENRAIVGHYAKNLFANFC